MMNLVRGSRSQETKWLERCLPQRIFIVLEGSQNPSRQKVPYGESIQLTQG